MQKSFDWIQSMLGPDPRIANVTLSCFRLPADI